MDARTKRVFKVVFATLFIDLLAFTLILPLLPKILDYYASNDKSGSFKLFEGSVEVLRKFLNVPESHNKVLLAGVLGSWFSLLQFITSPLFGAMSDKFGRKPLMIIAMAGTLVSYATWYLSTESFALFILSRTVGGLCKANVGLSLAIVSDVSTEYARGKGMAIVGSSFSLAFITGPLLGAYLASSASGDRDQSQLIQNPSLIALILASVSLIIIIRHLEETSSDSVNSHLREAQNREESILCKTYHYISPKCLFKFTLVEGKSNDQSRTLKKCGLIYFYYLLIYSGLEFTLSFLTHIRFGFSSMQQGKLYLFSGLIMAIIQGGYIRRMKCGKESLIALIGLSLIVPSFVIMGLSTSVDHIYISLSLYAFSSAVVVPCLTTIVSQYTPTQSKGVTMGLFRSIGALARALGPFLASLMFWTFGSKICYIGGALALLFPLYMMKNLNSDLKIVNYRFVRNHRKKSVTFDDNVARAN